MKIRLIAASIVLFSTVAVNAQNNNTADVSTFKFPNSMSPSWIRITNKSNSDIAYKVPNVFSGGRVYGIKKGEADTYTFKAGDRKMTFVETAVCNQMGATGSICTDYTPELQPCSPNPFAFKDVNFLTINTPTSCALIESFDW